MGYSKTPFDQRRVNTLVENKNKRGHLKESTKNLPPSTNAKVPVRPNTKWKENFNIFKLAKSLKLHNSTVALSNIVPPDDLYLQKADEVSANLEKLWKVNNIEVISHKNVSPKRRQNSGRLHFNDSGVSAFFKTL